MKKFINLSISILFAVNLISCQTVPYQGQAREVKRKPSEGGVIALTTDHRPEDRSKADEKMKSNCPAANVKILEEGEVAVGQTTTSNASEAHRPSSQKKVGTLFGMPLISGQAAGTDTTSSSTVTQLKEWQISYECVSSGSKKKVTH